MPGFFRNIYYALSPALRFALRRMYYLPHDMIHLAEYRRKGIPPKGMIYTGSGDYVQVGQRFLRYFRELGGLQPDHHVLDVGSGIGRMAYALSGYLTRQAKYEGFDIVKQGVQWCQKHISQTHPHFHFTHIPLQNDLYTSEGGDPVVTAFPYPSNTFDTTLVISVFTHMVRGEVEHYLREIHRTLNHGGVLFATFFILNPESREAMKEGPFKFEVPAEGCYLMDSKIQSANVAYDQYDLNLLLSQTGFLVKGFYPGSWSGRKEDVLDFQDILVLVKT